MISLFLTKKIFISIKILVGIVFIFLLAQLFLVGWVEAGICNCVCRTNCIIYPNPNPVQCCTWDECPFYCGDPECVRMACENCSGCSCFTGETEVEVKNQKSGVVDKEADVKKIVELKPGDVVSSFDPETGRVLEGTVLDIQKNTTEGYYLLETESGKQVKVTGEHPFLAVSEENFTAKIKEVFSTLTFQLITSLHNKLNGVFD